MRRCGSGQRCKASRDCATNLRCVKVTMSRGANGTVTQEARCSCPPGRYMSFKAGLPSCVRVQELCSNAHLDSSVESDVDCGGVCAAQVNNLCGYGKKCQRSTDCDSGVCDSVGRKCVCSPGFVPQGPFCGRPLALPPVAVPQVRPTTPGSTVPGGSGIPVTPLPPGGVLPVGSVPGAVPGVTPPLGSAPGGIPGAAGPNGTTPGAVPGAAVPGVSVPGSVPAVPGTPPGTTAPAAGAVPGVPGAGAVPPGVTPARPPTPGAPGATPGAAAVQPGVLPPGVTPPGAAPPGVAPAPTG